MKRTSMLKPELEERSFGSVYDPLLNGVAHGLAQLFPPVGGAGQREAGRPCESRRQDAQRSGEEKPESHTRA